MEGFGIKFRVEALGLRAFVGRMLYRKVAAFFRRMWFRSEHVSGHPCMSQANDFSIR